MLIDHLKVIRYITDMSKQMSHMAYQAHSPLLALLLDMVAKEGQNIINNNEALGEDSKSTVTHNRRSAE
ncbi:hypothetical protein X471_00205 [Bartonella bacilliformis str. Heidi Mejia]|uniref:hypothetical protein n=1 Tax=Bartonella bacilliformis TaxID=774 RepID=UPI00045058CA|nr:hypothetical protein [Bartonella bacilliformis]EYS91928.1 hypothetical protein X471_00205 [Bartonella bacilliformis str. Heidi Mejia]KEG16879.1 hypothetical protein H705_00767 [Bartonella bacilliformis Cond044]KEG19000.1 hypothetical protein H707_00742 [Bartonella bacilliformis Hosp800-02]KEG23511.1 hypothetical protein H708_00749 [Bartonella bacilliformis VAB9028]KEG24457.1 hypothetical protein H706_00752 [Bartonella bacilliformis CAR600-02]